MNTLRGGLFRKASFLCLSMVLPFFLQAQFYSGSQMDFGKNRIQYKDFIWSVFRFEKYETYFNVGGREIAVYTAKVAKKYIEETEKFMDHSMDEKIQFIKRLF